MKFQKNIDLVSGGSSITLPLLSKGKIPRHVNHLRIGEAVFLGTSPLTNKRVNKLSTNSFEFLANIVELEKKETYPDGFIGEGNVGHTKPVDERDSIRMDYKALVDFGVIDVDTSYLHPKDKGVEFIGTTSDLTVYNIGENSRKYKTGKTLAFQPNYMAVAQLMNSKFITKKIV
jgi:predicted amino acid racemase